MYFVASSAQARRHWAVVHYYPSYPRRIELVTSGELAQFFPPSEAVSMEPYAHSDPAAKINCMTMHFKLSLRTTTLAHSLTHLSQPSRNGRMKTLIKGESSPSPAWIQCDQVPVHIDGSNHHRTNPDRYRNYIVPRPSFSYHWLPHQFVHYINMCTLVRSSSSSYPTAFPSLVFF